MIVAICRKLDVVARLAPAPSGCSWLCLLVDLTVPISSCRELFLTIITKIGGITSTRRYTRQTTIAGVLERVGRATCLLVVALQLEPHGLHGQSPSHSWGYCTPSTVLSS